MFTHIGQYLVIKWQEYDNKKYYILYIGIHKTVHLSNYKNILTVDSFYVCGKE